MPSPSRPKRPTRANARRTSEPVASIEQQLRSHLENLTVPYLFVGAGFSIRYTQAESWADLLRRFATPAGKPYEYYRSTANGSLPEVASLIAEDFHEVWWSAAEFAESRDEFGAIATSRDSALKIEISRHLGGVVDRLPKDGDLAEELALLKTAVIDGIVTTNFDPVLEHLRPDLEPYVGQDELLFADPQGIGEVYKIHGSTGQPNSLVLTSEDYAVFNDRNAYLVAKLLAMFVEHPVLFIGYSLSDANVQSILVAIARCLTDERIESLRDRLLFVQWKPDQPPSMTSTVVSAEGFTIPVQSIVVPDYRDVFACLNGLPRRIPARWVRHLRKEVYELVKTNKPSERIYVEDLAADADPSDVQVYAGLGAITKVLTSYVGLDRKDLLADVLDDRGYDPRRVVNEAFPHMGSRTTNVPIYKYLRHAGFLTSTGKLADPDSLPKKLHERIESRSTLLQGLSSYEKRAQRLLADVTTFSEAVARCNGDELLYFIPFLPESFVDVEELGQYLRATKSVFDSDRQPLASQWAKAVCLYDWLRYGRAPQT